MASVPPPLPPPLPPEKSSFLTPTGFAGLVLVALSGALASGLMLDGDSDWGPWRFLMAVGGIVIGLLGLCFALVAERRNGGQRMIFFLSLITGVAAVALEVQSLVQPSREILAMLTQAAAGDAVNEEAVVQKAAEPIPIAPATLTIDAVEPYYRSWIEEKMVRAYDAHGIRNPAWDSMAREFIAGSMSSMLGLRGAPDAGQLATWSRQLESAKCRDPLVYYVMGRNDGSGTRREWFFREAAERLAKQGYAPGLVALARAELWSALRESDPKAAAALVPQMTAALRDEIAAAPLGDREYWMWNYLLTLGPAATFFEINSEAVVEVLEPLTTVEPWFKLLLHGAGQIDLAWESRGSGWSNEVTDEGWEGFRRHLAVAREDLTKSWTLHPEHPAAAHQMIRVALGDSDQPVEEMRLWFDRSVLARFDYSNAYKAFLWGLRPRWHGSHAAMLALGDACASTKRFDTIVPWQAFVASRDIASEWDRQADFYLEAAPYAQLREVCLGYAGAANAPEPAAYYLSHLALLAGACDHGEDVIEVLSQLSYRLDATAAADWGVDPEMWPGAYAMSAGPIAERMQAAEAAELRGEFTKAVESLQLAAGTPGLDQALRAFVERKIREVEKVQVLEKAAWEPLLPTTGLEEAVWAKLSGDWSRPDPETLELRASPGSYSQVFSNLRPGTIYELRGEIEHDPANADVSSGAVTVGWPEHKDAPWLGLRFQKRKRSGDQLILRQAQLAEQTFPVQLGDGANEFSIRASEGRIVTIVNDERVMDAAVGPPPNGVTTPPVLGFGTANSKYGATVRFRNLEWRRVATP